MVGRARPVIVYGFETNIIYDDYQNDIGEGNVGMFVTQYGMKGVVFGVCPVYDYLCKPMTVQSVYEEIIRKENSDISMDIIRRMKIYAESKGFRADWIVALSGDIDIIV